MTRAGATAQKTPAALATSAPVDEIVIVESAPRPRRADRWTGRAMAAALGVALGAVPLLVSLAVAVAAAQVVSPPSGGGIVIWWLSVFVASAVAAFGAQALLRRYFPLIGLLRLALAFPADVPSRLGLAMRAGTIRELERGVIDLRDGGSADPALAAAYVVASADALQRHDRFTRGHCERVRAYSDLVAAELGVSKQDRLKLRWAALLHDIGKLQVRTTILNKPGALDDEEWLEMRSHASVGLSLSEPLRSWLGEWVDGIGQHHERFDGTGYPLALAGSGISLAGRIVAVADSYETMTSARPYKKPMSHAAAREELVSSAGGHFDPAVVHAMLRLSVRRLRWVAGPLALLGDLVASRLIARGLPGRARSLGAGRVVRVVATSAAAAMTVSLGWMPSATGEGPTANHPTVDAGSKTAPPRGAAVVSDPAIAPSAPAASVDVAPPPSAGPSAEDPAPPTTTVTATRAVPPEPGTGGATPAVPASPARDRPGKRSGP